MRGLDVDGQLGPRGTFLVAATRMGGYHGYDEAGAQAPLGGAVTGFVKAYARERPEALVKAVDFAASRSRGARRRAGRGDPQRPRRGRDRPGRGRRWTVGLQRGPFGAGERRGLALGKDTVFAVTGAAGAIVSAIVADLAAASGGGIFHLLDLTPEPDPGDPHLAMYTTDRDGLKTVIKDDIAASGKRPTPVLIERELANSSGCSRR